MNVKDDLLEGKDFLCESSAQGDKIDLYFATSELWTETVWYV